MALQARHRPLPAHVHARRAGRERLDRRGRHGPARAVRRRRQAGWRHPALPVGAAGNPHRPPRRRLPHTLRRARQRARVVYAEARPAVLRLLPLRRLLPRREDGLRQPQALRAHARLQDGHGGDRGRQLREGRLRRDARLRRREGGQGLVPQLPRDRARAGLQTLEPRHPQPPHGNTGRVALPRDRNGRNKLRPSHGCAVRHPGNQSGEEAPVAEREDPLPEGREPPRGAPAVRRGHARGADGAGHPASEVAQRQLLPRLPLPAEPAVPRLLRRDGRPRVGGVARLGQQGRADGRSRLLPPAGGADPRDGARELQPPVGDHLRLPERERLADEGRQEDERRAHRRDPVAGLRPPRRRKARG